ncbi:MAG: glycosyltransferase family 39 protein, partial [Thermoanaerobaculia bacterium]
MKTTGRLALAAALAAGVAARVYAAFARPLWADEIFTLTLARRSVPDILAALRLDSGPPLHYLAAHVLLFPFPSFGAGDIVVRLFSLAASLLHLPVLILLGRRLGSSEAGLFAAGLYALFPLAVLYGIEGRGYALASLLALLAFERALVLRQRPRFGTGAALALCAAGAALTHY